MITPLADRFGRQATDLRVSLTDKCNLRCTYCMPAHGMAFLPGEELLQRDEIARLVGLAVDRFGVRQVRLTGGEPLIRGDLLGIVADIAALEPRPEISITTNGIGLAGKAEALREAGVDRINVSLDSLCADTFQTITRRPFLDKVLAGIDALAEAGYRNTKVNTVLLEGVNDHEAPELVEWALEHGHQLRFIEQMPLDAGHTWDREQMVTREELLDSLSARFTLEPVPGRGGAPAERWTIDGGPHTVGVIASVTAPFCGNCDRLRLTADGQLRNCLFSTSEYDLMPILRADPGFAGDGDETARERHAAGDWSASELAADSMLRSCIHNKLPGHAINDPSFLQPARGMNAIGG